MMMGVVFINNREIWMPKSAFFAIADDVLPFLKSKIDEKDYAQIAGSANSIEQLDLDDLDNDVIKQLFDVLKKTGEKYVALKPHIEKILN